MKPGARIIVAGGNRGWIGANLCHRLKQAGYEVETISSSTSSFLADWNWAEIQSPYTRVGRPFDAAFNVAGKKIFTAMVGGWSNRLREHVIESRVESNRVLKDLITTEKKPPQVYINISSAVTVYKGIYRPSYVHEHSEESTDYGDDFQGQMWSAAEAAGRIPDGHPTRQVTIRAGWVLGTGAGLFEFSRFWFGKHIGPKFGDGSQPFPWIHLDDLLGIRILTFALENPSVRGVLNAVAPQIITNDEYAQAFAAATGQGAPIRLPPAFLDTVLSKERADILLTGQKVVPKRTIELGYQFKFPDIRTAIADLLARDATTRHIPRPKYST